MTPETADPEIFRRYLLAEATEAETEALERAYLSDEEALEAISAAEHDLIDDYLSGHLDLRRKARFEEHYLASSVHRQRLAISRALRGQSPSWRRRIPYHWLAAAAATFVIALAGVFWLRVRLDADRVVAIALPAVQVRSETETPTARVGPDATDVELRFDRGDWEVSPPFHVTVRTVDGAEVWSGAADGTRQPLSVTIPASRLPAGDYVAVLSSGAADQRELRKSFFRIVRP